MTRDRDLVERELGHRAGDMTLKKPFRDKGSAKRWLKTARGLVDRAQLRAYRCGVCETWHVGNRP